MILAALRAKLRERGARGFAIDAGKASVGYAYIATAASGFSLAALAMGLVALPFAALGIPAAEPTSCRNHEDSGS